MRRTILVLTAAGLFAAAAGVSGQTPPAGGTDPLASGPIPQLPAPRPLPSAGTSSSSASMAAVPQLPAPSPSPAPGGWVMPTVFPAAPSVAKACVTEPKATTCVVYGSVCKEYCVPKCSLPNLLAGWFGDGCRTCDGCDLKYKRVLVKKVVPGPDVPACVLKDVPVGAWCPTPAQTLGPPVPGPAPARPK